MTGVSQSSMKRVRGRGPRCRRAASSRARLEVGLEPGELGLSARRPLSTCSTSAMRDAAREQQHAEVVEHVGGLLGHPLLGLLAGGAATTSLGLLLDLGADALRVVEQLDGVAALGPLASARLRSVRSSAAAPRRTGSGSPVPAARRRRRPRCPPARGRSRSARRCGRRGRPARPGRRARRRRSRSGAGAAAGCSPRSRPCARSPRGAAVEVDLAGLQREPQRLLVHVGERQHLARGESCTTHGTRPRSSKRTCSNIWQS